MYIRYVYKLFIAYVYKNCVSQLSKIHSRKKKVSSILESQSNSIY